MHQEKADHPHQAAVHLMRALKCCQDCTHTEDIDIIEINELQYRKNILAEELKQITIRGESVELLQSQIRQLDQLILKLQQENDRIEQAALNHVQLAVHERRAFEEDQLSGIMTELQSQIQENKQLKLQMEALMQKIKYLNRVNNELVFKFTNV